MARTGKKPIYNVRHKGTENYLTYEDRGADGRREPRHFREEYSEEDLRFAWPHGLPDDLETVQVGTY